MMHRIILRLSLFFYPINAQIRIVAPLEAVDLFGEKNGIIDGSTATFGAPYYGEKVMGKLLYREPTHPDHPHCSKEGFKDHEQLEELFQTKLNITEQSENGIKHKSKRVIVVDRGGCTFVTKVRVAQEFGAGAVIVVDNESSGLTKNQIHQLIMANDGYGELVKIPSVFVSYDEGKLLKEQIIANRNDGGVIAEMAWNVPSNDVVIMDLWMSPDYVEAQQFLIDFKETGEKLINILQFIPHYYMFNLESDFNHNCYSNNFYCSEDPDGPGPITGRNVVEESLRQLCVWEINAKRMGETTLDNVKSTNVFHSKEYWEYVALFAESCHRHSDDDITRFGTKQCSENVMKAVGISVDDVNACIDKDGEVLLKLQLANTAWSSYALRINGWRYSGPIERDLVRKAICSGFVKTPQECIDMEPVDSVDLAFHEANGIPLSTLVLSIVTTLGAVFIFMYFCCSKAISLYTRRCLQEEVCQQVSNQLAEYKALEGEEGLGVQSFGYSHKKFSDVVLPPRTNI